MGVTRGSLGNLNHVANDVGRHGSASMPVYVAAPNGGAEGNIHGATRGPAALRPGYAGEGSPGARGDDPGSAGGAGGVGKTGGGGGGSRLVSGGGGGGGGGGSAAAGGGAPARRAA